MMKGMKYTAISLIMGWWGIPWGPIYTCKSLYMNLSGGKDVTAKVSNNLLAEKPLY
jgi:hypothetical protein